MRKLTLASALLTLLFSGTVSAHGIWVAEQQGETAIIYGHGPENSSYMPERVVSIKGYIKDQVIDLERKDHKNFVTFTPAKAEAAAIILNNGIWTQFKDNSWVRKPKSEVQGDVNYSTESFKYTVTLFDHHVTPKAVGLPLEIVPEQNPLHMNEGDSVTVKVLLDGKPLSNAKVTNDYVNLGDDAYQTTDKDGKVTLQIRNAGLNVFAIGHQIDHNDKTRADKINYTATYSFTLHGDHHH